eukprot:7908613-Alexandrium_andersonii.AAC.1
MVRCPWRLPPPRRRPPLGALVSGPPGPVSVGLAPPQAALAGQTLEVLIDRLRPLAVSHAVAE